MRGLDLTNWFDDGKQRPRDIGDLLASIALPCMLTPLTGVTPAGYDADFCAGRFAYFTAPAAAEVGELWGAIDKALTDAGFQIEHTEKSDAHYKRSGRALSVNVNESPASLSYETDADGMPVVKSDWQKATRGHRLITFWVS